MANFDHRFQAGTKVSSNGHDQIFQEEFKKSWKSENAGDQPYNFNTIKSGPGFEGEYAQSFASNPPCIQGIHLDHNPTVIQTHEAAEITNLKKSNQKRKTDRAIKYAFLTKSETKVLDDGYKWRKYGKKLLKNSPNPRNYYRCSNSNCDVKKTVERDTHDKGIVITTYMGQHNHENPTVIYYI